MPRFRNRSRSGTLAAAAIPRRASRGPPQAASLARPPRATGTLERELHLPLGAPRLGRLAQPLAHLRLRLGSDVDAGARQYLARLFEGLAEGRCQRLGAHDFAV